MTILGRGGFAGGRALQATKRSGVLSTADVLRMTQRANPKLFGIDPSSFPESAPDEEEMLKARRRSIARQRRRSGRMSTILTGGLGGDTPTALGA